MGKIAFLFPGQGAQYSGMGRELYHYSKGARRVFRTMDTLIPGLSQTCFQGTPEELSQTHITQPCVFTVNMAASEALREYGVAPDYLLGFSLGELCAVASSGILSMEETGLLVQKRAQWMSEASIHNPGAMAAVIGILPDKVLSLTQQFTKVWPVNYNYSKQTVVAGDPIQVEEFGEKVQEAKGSFMPLKVSGAFHTPFMAPAQEALRAYLTHVPMGTMNTPVISNKTAKPYAGDYRSLIHEQVTNSVQFEKSVIYLAEQGVDTFIELGPGKTLSGFVKRILPQSLILRVEDLQTLKQTLGALRRDIAA